MFGSNSVPAYAPRACGPAISRRNTFASTPAIAHKHSRIPKPLPAVHGPGCPRAELHRAPRLTAESTWLKMDAELLERSLLPRVAGLPLTAPAPILPLQPRCRASCATGAQGDSS